MGRGAHSVLRLQARISGLQRCPLEAPLRSGSAVGHGIVSRTPFYGGLL